MADGTRGTAISRYLMVVDGRLSHPLPIRPLSVDATGPAAGEWCALLATAVPGYRIRAAGGEWRERIGR